MARDPGVESVFPLLLAEPHAHRNLVIECDARVGLESARAPAFGPGMPAGKITGYGSPRHCEVDRARRQVALDDHRWILVDVAALLRVVHAIVEQLVAQQPVDSGRAGKDA